MQESRLKRQIRFLLEVDKLKDVFRRSYLLSSRRRENDSEHSWHVALMALLLSEHADERIDTSRAVTMCLVHDVVEIDAGDTYCYDEAAGRDKAERELRAANRLFGLLPEDQARELMDLWREFEEGCSPEARFAHAVDRLMPLLHNYYTGGRSWREHGVGADRVRDRMRPIRESSQRLWDFAQEVIRDAEASGYLGGNDEDEG